MGAAVFVVFVCWGFGLEIRVDRGCGGGGVRFPFVRMGGGGDVGDRIWGG